MFIIKYFPRTIVLFFSTDDDTAPIYYEKFFWIVPKRMNVENFKSKLFAVQQRQIEVFLPLQTCFIDDSCWNFWVLGNVFWSYTNEYR